MAEWSISQVAQKVGLRSSAIRYYEQIGILEPARRRGGQRRYDDTVLYRLAVLRRAQDAGFSLDEIRHLFFGFSTATPISLRWKKIAERKMVELDAKLAQIQSMRVLLKKLEACCECETVERCGAGILRSGFLGKPLLPVAARLRGALVRRYLGQAEGGGSGASVTVRVDRPDESSVGRRATQRTAVYRCGSSGSSWPLTSTLSRTSKVSSGSKAASPSGDSSGSAVSGGSIKTLRWAKMPASV
jgi:MerR family redox-sensitive transcriptional activator SoxR